MTEYIPAKQAAEELGLKYGTLLARVRAGTVKAERVGWAVLVRKDEVERIKRNANNQNLAKSAR